jgi:hypothetical protein
LDHGHACLLTTPQSTDRLNDKRHRTLCRAFIGEQQPGIGGHDANKRECRKIKRLGGEGGADENLRSTTTERIEDAVTRANCRRGICVKSINDHIGKRGAHLGLQALGATSQRPNAGPTTGGAASERLRRNATSVAAQQ